MTSFTQGGLASAPALTSLRLARESDVEAALARYAAGVWVAEQSLPDPFDGVLWGVGG